MGNLQTRHLVETALWLGLVLFFYFHSFAFDKEIEIYRYGATAWPRAILLMMAIIAIGQLLYYWKIGESESSSMLGAVMEDSAERAKRDAQHSSLGWYLSTAAIVALPFVYMNLPQMLVSVESPNDPALHRMKLIVAALVLIVYLAMMWKNRVGGILALPMLFAAMLQDFGFYSLAPFFIIGVMYLMGERKIRPMTWVMPLIMGLLLLFFVKLLYVGLPTGNIKPFYDIGNWVVTVLQ